MPNCSIFRAIPTAAAVAAKPVNGDGEILRPFVKTPVPGPKSKVVMLEKHRWVSRSFITSSFLLAGTSSGNESFYSERKLPMFLSLTGNLIYSLCDSFSSMS